jgi:lariat debranching enzyme
MRILVTGCLHGAWEPVIQTADNLISHGNHIDLIIVMGDAQTMRNSGDLDSFHCPRKYRQLGTFPKLLNGELTPPCLILVIGGNHEACDFLHQLPFGGWLAPRVFFLGRAASVRFGSLTISGLSGIFKNADFWRPVDESFPLRSVSDMLSAVHYRYFSFFQLMALSGTDVMLSHDWPSGVAAAHGGAFLRTRKRYIVDDDAAGTLGIRRAMTLRSRLRPKWWFAAHHHIRFATAFNGTQFLALDKPKGSSTRWREIVEVDADIGDAKLRYVGQWIAILRATGNEMADPARLRETDWETAATELRDLLEQIDDVEVGEYDPDPAAATAKFCQTFGVFCPNAEIRKLMGQ